MTENNDYSYLLDIINLVEDKDDDGEKINIRFDGDFAVDNDIKTFNSNFLYTLINDSRFNVAISEKSKINETTDKSIKSLFNAEIEKVDLNIDSTNSTQFIIPNEGHWISINNFDLGSLPKAWVESINDYLDEVWVSSNYMKNNYINSGIDKNKIRVINYGTDPLVYNPNVEKAKIETNKKFKLIYKGDLNWKSGFDILLKAFTDEFMNDEDIVLIVIPDNENADISQINKIKNFLEDKDCPEMLVYNPIDNFSDIASLYKASDFIVSPYRTETLCANIVNAMSCGTPAIITNKGVSEDYCNKDNSILLNSETVYNNSKNIQDMETINYPYWQEVDLMTLRVALRKAFEINKSEYDSLSNNSSKNIIDNFTYIKISEKIKPELKEILLKPIKRETQNLLNKYMLSGLNSLTQGNLDNAVNDLSKALDISETNENTNFYMANIMLSKGDFSKALDYILISLKMNPNNEDYNNLIGIILYKLGNYKYAEEFFKRTIKIMPEHSGAYESLKAVEVIKTSNFSNSEIPEDKKIDIDKILGNYTYNQTLSVCIIAKNEEKNIEKAIKSVKDFANEIILVDTGSSDKTVEIAQKENVKVFQYEWDYSFANARNEALKHASMDWVLMLDADEYIDAIAKDSIIPLLSSLNKNKIYQVKVINFIDKNNINETFEHFVPRLIPNNKAIKFIRDIHEYPVNNDNSEIESEILSSFHINHSGYLNANVKEKDKTIRNRNILEKSLSTNNQSLIDYFYLAENYKEDKNFDKVIEYSQEVIDISNNDIEKYKNHYDLINLSKINLLEALISKNDYKKAIEIGEGFKNNLELRPDFWFLLGSAEFNLNNFDKCIEYQKKVLSLRDQSVFPSIDTGVLSWKPLSLIGESYLKKQDIDNALLFFKKAIKEKPDNISFYFKIAEIYSFQNKINEMETIITKFIKFVNPDDLSYLIDKIYTIYTQNSYYERLYKFLEYVRQNKSLEKNNINLVNTLIKIYNQILNLYPDINAVKYSIACAYESIKDYKNAEAIFNEISEEGTDSLHNLASIAYSTGDFDKSEMLYKKVLEKDEFYIQSYIGIIRLYINNKETEKAFNYIEKLKSIDPDNQEISELEFEIAKQDKNTKLASDIYASMLFKRDFLK